VPREGVRVALSGQRDPERPAAIRQKLRRVFRFASKRQDPLWPVPVVHPLDVALGNAAVLPVLSSILQPRWPEYEDAEVSLRDVDVDEVCPVVLVVERFRLLRVEALLAGYEQAGLAPFSPALVEVEYGKTGNTGFRLLLPPVVEYSDRGSELVDGAHRLYTLRAMGGARTRALVVERRHGGFSPAAGKPGTWDCIKVVTKKQSRERRFENYNPDHFRPVGKFLSGNALKFQSVEDFRSKLSRAQSDGWR
jgi:hypothetical protein